MGLPLAGMPDSQRVNGETRHETQLERLDRNLEEMTGELRVVVTGVQVLFAFLLIVPFDTGFAHVGSFERTVNAPRRSLSRNPEAVGGGACSSGGPSRWEQALHRQHKRACLKKSR
jgi:hypothetical protein